MNFDLELARQCLKFSARAYVEATFAHKSTSTEVLVLESFDSPRTTFVAFRGSREPRDFIMDAKFIIKDSLFGIRDWQEETCVRVHRGFLRGYEAVSAELVDRVRCAERIICCGHSLGGARSVIASEHFNRLGLPVEGVFAFGCPRVGNRAWRAHYNAELHDMTFLIEAQGDLVPWLPPYLLHGYRHVGRCVQLRNNGVLTVDAPLWSQPTTYALARFGNEEVVDEQRGLLGFSAHAIENYERLFKGLKS